ncbi:hypothetical protein DZ901_09785 [Pseudomonas aeruginosa]|uniref:hypothetical protein n=1 Tax=Pseudomonas aeruginosa TaxID=287 RepID=UPI000E30C248|nr:hypothetical protein [Pseudomonas aeruginosa]MBT9310073.1 hypothetical protein [Pseudomonas aeruginosa]RFJ36430.1 hypothetical protein DZ924_13770 [Pseudomonas aeruginosa]RFL53640.1 hypothetical protein DZ901_09785 [Pseudomonas aeruginosa]HBO3650054.1 hypothetical protein [Pseudomonas aeruginosa]HBO5449326.1 hypothetical protein [Pseudomonas aeruginosa]
MLGRAALLYGISALALNAAIASEDCPPQEAEIAELKLILKNDPTALALESSKTKKPYFLAVRGYSTEVPGVSDSELQCAYERTSIKPLPATSDVLCTDEIVALQPIARDFCS